MKPYVIGVDVGGTSVKFGLFTTDGSLRDKWSIETRTCDSGAPILPDVTAAIQNKLHALSLSPSQIEGVGFGVPGPVDADNNVPFCVNLGWKEPFNLKTRMNTLLPDIPNVAAANDANAAALGEMWTGGGRGYSSLVLLTLGTGVGGGVVMNGKIVAGTHGVGGEIGHMTMNPQETVTCTCGKKGCLEQYASARGILHLAADFLAHSALPSALRTLDSFTAREICDLARDGDPAASAILHRCGSLLGQAMSFVSCTFDPELFLIGGGMSKAGDILLNAIREGYRPFAFGSSRDTPILPAKLGNDAGIYGCAKLVLP